MEMCNDVQRTSFLSVILHPDIWLQEIPQLTLTQSKQPLWCLMDLPFVETQRVCFWHRNTRESFQEKERDKVLNKQTFVVLLPHHVSVCSALSQGLPGGWWVNRPTSQILPSPMGQAVFAQQHRGIQEMEEIPSLPAEPRSPPPLAGLTLVCMHEAALLIQADLMKIEGMTTPRTHTGNLLNKGNESENDTSFKYINPGTSFLYLVWKHVINRASKRPAAHARRRFVWFTLSLLPCWILQESFSHSFIIVASLPSFTLSAERAQPTASQWTLA